MSPPPGDSDVISHVDRLISNETKIAPRSVRIAVGASGRSATVCMVASRVGGSNLTLPKCRSLSTSPWDLVTEAGLKALEFQLQRAREAYETAQKIEEVNERRRQAATPLRDVRYLSARVRTALVIPIRRRLTLLPLGAR